MASTRTTPARRSSPTTSFRISSAFSAPRDEGADPGGGGGRGEHTRAALPARGARGPLVDGGRRGQGRRLHDAARQARAEGNRDGRRGDARREVAETPAHLPQGDRGSS